MKDGYRKRLAFICMLSVAVLAGCGDDKSKTEEDSSIAVEEEKSPIEYKMDVVRRGDVVNTATVKCAYLQMQSEDLSYKTGNEKIYSVYVEKGDMVKKGDLLVKLDVEDLEKKVKSLNYDIDYNQMLLQQKKDLMAFDLNARLEQYKVTKSTLSTTVEQVDAKEAYDKDVKNIKESYRTAIEDCEDNLKIYKYRQSEYQKKVNEGCLYAGMDGTISFVKANLVGSLTKKKDVIVSIVNNDVCAFTSHSSEFAKYFKEGEPVSIGIGLSDKKEYEAYPYKMNEWGEDIYFALSEPDDDITIGTNGDITVEIEKAKDVLYVSKDAIHLADDKTYVFQVDDEGMRYIQYVETGLESDNTVEIKSGLSEGDYVITK